MVTNDECSAIRGSMNVADYYQALQIKRASLLAESVADEQTFALHVISHNFLKDFEIVLDIAEGAERGIFMQASREFQYSLEAVICGNYRHAFSSLRLTLELFTAAIYFSAHQMKLNLWLAGSDDLFWRSLIDKDKGVYSDNFMKAFHPDLGSYRIQYMSLAEKVYRECSEYVHGNPATNDNPELQIAYNAEKVQQFHDKVATIRLCVLFQFFARYLVEMNPEKLGKVEYLAMETFGDLTEIQASFGADGK